MLRWWLLLGACFVGEGRRRLASELPPAAVPGDEAGLAEDRRRLGASYVAPTSADDHLVKSLPGLSGYTHKHWAGLLTVDPAHSGRLFYWLFEPTGAPPEDADVLIWLNGGPGCSSMDGLFLENGPFRVREDGTLDVNEHSWNDKAYLLYVDQPVGTGFSYTSQNAYAKNDEMINAGFYAFLQAFYALHPSLAGRRLFFSGESHAGHYIPSMVAYIRSKNAVPLGAGEVAISVGGMAVGNGWTDPYNQYDVRDFAWGKSLVGKQQLPTLKALESSCHADLRRGKYSSSTCFSLLDKVIDASGPPGQRAIMYDVRRRGKTSDYPPGKQRVEEYLNRDDVKSAIHSTSTPQRFQECADPPYFALSGRDGIGVTGELASSLDAGVPTLYYSGNQDAICNYAGTERLLHALDWTGADDWRAAPRFVWQSHGAPAGFAKAHGPLTFLVVEDAGHMVPMVRAPAPRHLAP